MAKSKSSDSFVVGIILILIGGIVLLNRLDIDVWRITLKLWPVILIVWGANKLMLGLKERDGRTSAPSPDKGHEI